MNKSLFALLGISFLCVELKGQINQTDSTKQLSGISIQGYHNVQPLLRSPSAISMVDSALIRQGDGSSLLQAVNAIAGLRMEERSPGSYRFSIRGSLLRSPFGIRNLKFYIDDFPLTDAGGNTYLNLMDINGMQAIEVYKGPEASMFGANTGGAVLIRSASGMPMGSSGEAGVNMGSYGLFHPYGKVYLQKPHYTLSVTAALQQSDGYRQQSALQRSYLQILYTLNYHKRGILKAFVMASDLQYQTPGGLTLEQATQDPRMARPSTLLLPGAIAQKAAVYNQTLYGGISSTFTFHRHLKHVIAVFSAHTDFKNPFITNYEKRQEYNLGLRTFLDLSFENTALNGSVQWGIESALNNASIANYVNNGGTPGMLQARDRLKADQTFLFLRMNTDIAKRLWAEFGSSLNLYQYHYQRSFPIPSGWQEKRFADQLMPKAAVSYLLRPWLSARASLSRGYSSPTLAEVRASDQQVNVDLQAEQGWNKEIGIRLKTPANRVYLNINAFSFQLDKAIVRRMDEQDAEYFINSGGTRQQGIEAETAMMFFDSDEHRLWIKSSYTFSAFRFRQFSNASAVYDGKMLTGIPRHAWSTLLNFTLKKNFFMDIQHRYNGTIPLNDANTVRTSPYHIIDLKAGINEINLRKTKGGVFSGVNNLFNTRYSLGNDLNAAGGRYYNPAAGIYFYFGLKLYIFMVN